MPVPLLETKLFIPPTRPAHIGRGRLIERLNSGLHRKLTLISAPAGFGKTSLISEWVKTFLQNSSAAADEMPECGHDGCSTAWISLDAGDGDPVSFISCFISALRRADGTGSGFAAEALDMLQAPRPVAKELYLTSLINELAAVSGKIVVILDDYHLLSSPEVDEAVAFLIKNQPPSLHLVISTREDPAVPLGRLRGRDELTELRAADLRFSASEIAEFFRRESELMLTDEETRALEGRTEGWAAGLQLAALSMKGHDDTAERIKSFTGSSRIVLDYLIEEVLSQQPENIQDFLLKTSILPRISGPLCDAVTGGTGGKETLEYLDRANLFTVPLDSEGTWFRYHHLFADLLRHRLKQTGEESLPELYDRASVWFSENGAMEEAIEYAFHSGDIERAGELIGNTAETVWASGVDTVLRKWLGKLPGEFIYSRPRLCIFHAWYLLAEGKMEDAGELLQAAQRRIDLETGTPDNIPRLRGRLAAARAFSAFYRGDTEAIINDAEEALALLPEDDTAWRGAAAHIQGDAYDFRGEAVKAYHSRLEALEAGKAAGNRIQTLIIGMKLAITMRVRGMLHEAAEICAAEERKIGKNASAYSAAVGWLYAIWGEVLAEMNDMDRALEYAKKGVETGERGGDLAMFGSSCIFLARVLFTRGDYRGAEETIRKIENSAREVYMPPWILNITAAWKARIWIARGKTEAASRLLAERGITDSCSPEYSRELECIVRAHLLILEGKTGMALGLLGQLLTSAEAGGRITSTIEILIFTAIAHDRRGDTDNAVNSLKKALTLAEPGGYVRIFSDKGPAAAKLLYEAFRRGISTDYIHDLLTAFSFETLEKGNIRPAAPDTDSPAAAAQVPSLLPEPLSGRELDVLRLMAEGLTNEQVGIKLFISVHTVKVHSRNIYAKLECHNRTQAVAKARTFGLLQPLS